MYRAHAIQTEQLSPAQVGNFDIQSISGVLMATCHVFHKHPCTPAQVYLVCLWHKDRFVCTAAPSRSTKFIRILALFLTQACWPCRRDTINQSEHCVCISRHLRGTTVAMIIASLSFSSQLDTAQFTTVVSKGWRAGIGVVAVDLPTHQVA